MRPRQAVRQGVGVRDVGPEIPRQGARHLLGGSRPQAVKVREIQLEGMWESDRKAIDADMLAKMGRPGLVNLGRLNLAKLFRR